jgi:hypothetical protein
MVPVGGGGTGSSPHAPMTGSASNMAAARYFVNLLISFLLIRWKIAGSGESGTSGDYFS